MPTTPFRGERVLKWAITCAGSRRPHGIPYLAAGAPKFSAPLLSFLTVFLFHFLNGIVVSPAGERTRFLQHAHSPQGKCH